MKQPFLERIRTLTLRMECVRKYTMKKVGTKPSPESTATIGRVIPILDRLAAERNSVLARITTNA